MDAQTKSAAETMREIKEAASKAVAEATSKRGDTLLSDPNQRT